MDCPKCKSEMEFADIGGIHTSRCLQCRGLWFKEDGHQRLRKIKGSQAIDVGDAEIGKSFDAGEYKDFKERTLGDLFKKIW